MTDYIADLDSNSRWIRAEAENCAKRLQTETTITDGVIRWNSNNAVPPPECIALARYIGLPIDIEKCNETRNADVRAFVAEYRKVRGNRELSGEERSELRANHAPGSVVVDVISGQRFKL